LSETISSISEITRVGGWALRGLGYPFGVAERANRLLAWMQAVDGSALKSIRKLEANINASLRAEAVKITKVEADYHLDAAGRHILDIGLPVMDLATSDARHKGIGRAAVANVCGLNFVPALASLLALRKLDGLIIYRAGSLDVLPNATPRSGWISTSAANGLSSFRMGGLEDRPERFVNEIFTRAMLSQGSPIAARTEAIKGDSNSNESLGFMSITAVERSTDQPSLVDPQVSAGREYDFDQRLAIAFRDGFSIDREDLDYLYQLEMRTWAPTSERSRSQAGYGVY
jgi:hypothetical protein